MREFHCYLTASANGSLVASYVQIVCDEKTRTGMNAKMNGIASIGLVLGPALCVGLVITAQLAGALWN